MIATNNKDSERTHRLRGFIAGVNFRILVSLPIFLFALQVALGQIKPLADNEAMDIWNSTVKAAKKVAVFNLNDSHAGITIDKSKSVFVPVGDFKIIRIRPLKALLAEGGNKFSVFLDRENQVVGVYFLISSANSLYGGGWQMRPVNYEEKVGGIGNLRVRRIGLEDKNNIIFLPYGSAIDNLMLRE